jgi:hypothetical protein
MLTHSPILGDGQEQVRAFLGDNTFCAPRMAAQDAYTTFRRAVTHLEPIAAADGNRGCCIEDADLSIACDCRAGLAMNASDIPLNYHRHTSLLSKAVGAR